MFAKLLVIVLSLGICGCWLLSLRQERLAITHEIALSHRRVIEQERNVWRMRAEIARRCSPAHLKLMRDAIAADWSPLERSLPTLFNPGPNAGPPSPTDEDHAPW
ncbi:MAG: hypothetical protein ACR2GY_08905 [Phycisphaerales bacterium]